MIKDSEGRNRVHIQYLQVYKSKKREKQTVLDCIPKGSGAMQF